MRHELPKALRDDVRLLGELLGETLRRQEGQAIYDTVERVRALSKKSRGGSEADFATLTRILEQMPIEEAVPVARAFSHFLNLANIAEQHHRIRRRRAYQRNPDAPAQIGSCDETFGRLIASGVAPDRLYDAVARLRVELVFTAHPTEVTRRTLLQKFGRIADLLALRDQADLTPPERDELVDGLRIEIAAAWETSEIRPHRPSPVDEVRSGLAVFEQSVWDALPRFLRGLNLALVKHTGRGLPPDRSPISFGSWIGGDRDGNPAVTATVTATAVLLARWQAASLYLQRDRGPPPRALDAGRQRRADRARRRRGRAVSRGAARRTGPARRDPARHRGPARAKRGPGAVPVRVDRRSRRAARPLPPLARADRQRACWVVAACSTCSARWPPSAPRWCASTCARTPRGTPARWPPSPGTWGWATTPPGTRPPGSAFSSRSWPAADP